jgi:hypothetical protein
MLAFLMATANSSEKPVPSSEAGKKIVSAAQLDPVGRAALHHQAEDVILHDSRARLVDDFNDACPVEE